MSGKLKLTLDDGTVVEVSRTAMFRAAGSIKSKKKAEAARINGLRGGAPRLCVRCKKHPPQEGDTLCFRCEAKEQTLAIEKDKKRG